MKLLQLATVGLHLRRIREDPEPQTKVNGIVPMKGLILSHDPEVQSSEAKEKVEGGRNSAESELGPL